MNEKNKNTFHIFLIISFIAFGIRTIIQLSKMHILAGVENQVCIFFYIMKEKTEMYLLFFYSSDSLGMT